jgi:hypothetical protein
MNAICPFCGATLDEEQQCKKTGVRRHARRSPSTDDSIDLDGQTTNPAEHNSALLTTTDRRGEKA